ncbi:hypothetical protein BGZ98_004729, partial [Dissophora globulifera]
MILKAGKNLVFFDDTTRSSNSHENSSHISNNNSGTNQAIMFTNLRWENPCAEDGA